MSLRTLVLISAVVLLAACQSGAGTSSQANTGAVANAAAAGNTGVTEASAGTTSSRVGNTGVTLGQTSGPTGGIMLLLSWQPNPDPVGGYIVYNGPTPATTASVVSVTSDTAAQFDAVADLGLNPGDTTCFRLRAYNADGQSGYSDAVCINVQST